jgi:hypothetical protein
MNKILTFGEFPDEPDKPVIGIYQQLAEAEKRKKLEREAAQKVVDNGLLIDDSTITKKTTVAEKTTLVKNPTVVKTTTEDTIAKPTTVAERTIDDGYVALENNWMKLDLDILKVMQRLSGTEFKVYIYFLSRSYGAWEPKNICSVSLAMIAEILGVESTGPVSKCVKSLIQQGFLKRQFKGESGKDMSIYRVFLPFEIPNVGGKTKITLLSK